MSDELLTAALSLAFLAACIVGLHWLNAGQVEACEEKCEAQGMYANPIYTETGVQCICTAKPG